MKVMASLREMFSGVMKDRLMSKPGRAESEERAVRAATLSSEKMGGTGPLNLEKNKFSFVPTFQLLL
jgi:hypothetical protein